MIHRLKHLTTCAIRITQACRNSSLELVLRGLKQSGLEDILYAGTPHSIILPFQNGLLGKPESDGRKIDSKL
jgi:hypothetical protein